MGNGVGGRLKRDRIYAHLQLIHRYKQKPTECHKAIILQLLYSRNQHSILKQLSSNYIFFKKLNFPNSVFIIYKMKMAIGLSCKLKDNSSLEAHRVWHTENVPYVNYD